MCVHMNDCVCACIYIYMTIWACTCTHTHGCSLSIAISISHCSHQVPVTSTPSSSPCPMESSLSPLWAQWTFPHPQGRILSLQIKAGIIWNYHSLDGLPFLVHPVCLGVVSPRLPWPRHTTMPPSTLSC